MAVFDFVLCLFAQHLNASRVTLSVKLPLFVLLQFIETIIHCNEAKCNKGNWFQLQHIIQHTVVFL